MTSKSAARARAFAVHLLLSVVVAALAAVTVFFIWYPAPYRELAGGGALFVILVAVDIVIGPLLTLVVFNQAKPRRTLLIDLSAIALAQAAALAYGMHTVYVARPVHVVFEYDRFRLVRALDVPRQLLAKTPSGIDALPLTGPTLLATRPVRIEEKFDTAMAEMAGLPIGARPDFWLPMAAEWPQVVAQSRPINDLIQRFPAQTSIIRDHLARIGEAHGKLRYVPLIGRSEYWTAVIRVETADIIAVLPVDPL